MSRLHALIFLGLTGVVGCSSSQSAGDSQPAVSAPNNGSSDAINAPSVNSPNIAKPAVNANKTPSIETVPIPSDVQSTLTDADRPASVPAFIAKFHELHQKDVFAPFVELSYWGDMSAEDRKDILGVVRQTFWIPSKGKMKEIRSANKILASPINLSGPEKPDGYMAAFPLAMYQEDMSDHLVPKPTHELEVQASIDGSTSMFLTYLIGQHEGKYYFCTVK